MEDLEAMSFEELIELKVTSVSKKEETLFGAAAAVYVLTNEDIRRSGATTIPEALRMVPGMQVAHIDSGTWAISARGFNSRFANNLLVLIDGRSVYSLVFSGVFWDTQDAILEDVDRIEIIRGPGATLWGANAVNGVINIVTKNSKETVGGMVSAGGGTEEQAFGSVRYGEKVGDNLTYRIYGKHFERDEFVGQNGDPAADSWSGSRGGFRMDWDLPRESSLTAMGEFASQTQGLRHKDNLVLPRFPFASTFDEEEEVINGHFLTKWSRKFSETSNMHLQFYYDRDERDFENTSFQILNDTYDLEFHHRFALSQRQEIAWGLGQRYIVDSFDNSANVKFNPRQRLNYNTNFFFQDEITLVPQRLKLTVGSKFSVNNVSGFEFQPSGRMAWTPNDKHTLWGSVSRAVRTPNRINDSVDFKNRVVALPGGTPIVASNFGNLDFESEEVLALESGYRVKPAENIFLDFAAFYNFYDSLLTVERKAPFFETSGSSIIPILPFPFDNKGSGETYGLEAAAQWNVSGWWKIKGAFTWFQMDLTPDSDSLDTTFEPTEENDPEIQWNLRSYMDLPHNVEFDTTLYFVDELNGMNIPQYARWDVRLAWRPVDSLEISLVGQNLSDSKHPEFGDDQFQFIARTLVERSVYGKVVWKF